jgi:zinc protease
MPTNFPAFPEVKGRQLLVVDRSDLKQSEIRFGHAGIQRNHPDYLALKVANMVLGGNFSSRLMKEIRVKRGLTYGVRSRFDTGVFVGPFEIEVATRHDKVGETVTETLRVLKEFTEGGLTQAELDMARVYLIGQFVEGMETPEAVARTTLALRLYGIPDSYLKEYISLLGDLKLADVNAAIRRNLHPDNIKVLVYSKKSEVLEQLKALGTVEVKSYKELL